MLSIFGKINEKTRIHIQNQRKIIFRCALSRTEYARASVYSTDYTKIYGDIRILRQLASGVDILAARGLQKAHGSEVIRQTFDMPRGTRKEFSSSYQVPSPTFCAAKILSLKLSSHVSPFLKSGAVPIYPVPAGRVTVIVPLSAKVKRIQHSKFASSGY